MIVRNLRPGRKPVRNRACCPSVTHLFSPADPRQRWFLVGRGAPSERFAAGPPALLHRSLAALQLSLDSTCRPGHGVPSKRRQATTRTKGEPRRRATATAQPGATARKRHDRGDRDEETTGGTRAQPETLTPRWVADHPGRPVLRSCLANGETGRARRSLSSPTRAIRAPESRAPA